MAPAVSMRNSIGSEQFCWLFNISVKEGLVARKRGKGLTFSEMIW